MEIVKADHQEEKQKYNQNLLLIEKENKKFQKELKQMKEEMEKIKKQIKIMERSSSFYQIQIQYEGLFIENVQAIPCLRSDEGENNKDNYLKDKVRCKNGKEDEDQVNVSLREEQNVNQSLVQMKDLIEGKVFYKERQINFGQQNKQNEASPIFCRQFLHSSPDVINDLQHDISILKNKISCLLEQNNQLKRSLCLSEKNYQQMKNNYLQIEKQSKFMSNHIKNLSTDKYNLQKKIKQLQKQLIEISGKKQLNERRGKVEMRGKIEMRGKSYMRGKSESDSKTNNVKMNLNPNIVNNNNAHNNNIDNTHSHNNFDVEGDDSKIMIQQFESNNKINSIKQSSQFGWFSDYPAIKINNGSGLFNNNLSQWQNNLQKLNISSSVNVNVNLQRLNMGSSINVNANGNIYINENYSSNGNKNQNNNFNNSFNNSLNQNDNNNYDKNLNNHVTDRFINNNDNKFHKKINSNHQVNNQTYEKNNYINHQKKEFNLSPTHQFLRKSLPNYKLINYIVPFYKNNNQLSFNSSGSISRQSKKEIQLNQHTNQIIYDTTTINQNNQNKDRKISENKANIMNHNMDNFINENKESNNNNSNESQYSPKDHVKNRPSIMILNSFREKYSPFSGQSKKKKVSLYDQENQRSHVDRKTRQNYLENNQQNKQKNNEQNNSENYEVNSQINSKNIQRLQIISNISKSIVNGSQIGELGEQQQLNSEQQQLNRMQINIHLKLSESKDYGQKDQSIWGNKSNKSNTFHNLNYYNDNYLGINSSHNFNQFIRKLSFEEEQENINNQKDNINDHQNNRENKEKDNTQNKGKDKLFMASSYQVIINSNKDNNNKKNNNNNYDNLKMNKSGMVIKNYDNLITKSQLLTNSNLPTTNNSNLLTNCHSINKKIENKNIVNKNIVNKNIVNKNIVNKDIKSNHMINNDNKNLFSAPKYTKMMSKSFNTNPVNNSKNNKIGWKPNLNGNNSDVFKKKQLVGLFDNH